MAFKRLMHPMTILLKLRRSRWYIKGTIKCRIKVIKLRHNRCNRKRLARDWYEPLPFKRHWMQ